jgi:hypothetical protein
VSRERRQSGSEDNLPKRGNWYLLTGVVIGILLGLVVSWVIAPVKYVDTVPSSLRVDFKDEFRSRIASAYNATLNLPRARARLALLGDPDPIQALTFQAQSLVAGGDPTGTAFILAFLADALKQSPTGQSTISNTLTLEPDITPTSTPLSTVTAIIKTPRNQPTSLFTFTPRPTITSTPTPGAPFILKSSQSICDDPSKSLLLQVEVNNSANQPIPGAEIIISWANGEEHFFTGLKPEMGDGYADYLMVPDTIYIVRLAEGGAPVTNLSAPSCSIESGTTNWGSLKLIFQQP